MTRLVRFSNNAVSRLAANITNASTTISLTPGDGAKFPVISGTQFFMATLIKSTGETEIVKVTARATDTLTVVRAAEPVGATQVAYAFSAGDRIEQRLTAKALSDELDRLDSGANIGATNKTANYTVQAADVSTLIRVDTTAGAITITLPEIASLADDFDIMVAKVTDNANAVNIVRAGSTDLINGATSYHINNQWQSAWLIADRSTNTWTAINSGAATSSIAVDTFTGDGTAGPYTLSGDPVSKANTAVYLSGVYQQKATYTLSGTSLTMGGNVPVGVTVEVVWSRPLSIGRTDAGLVTYDGGTVQDVLDGAVSKADYVELRAYTGRANRIYITGLLVTAKPAGIAGVFQHDTTDNTSFDNGGTVIVGADGRRWKRDYVGAVNLSWFGALGSGSGNDTAAINAAFSSGAKRFIAEPGSVYPVSGSISISNEIVFDAQGATFSATLAGVSETTLLNISKSARIRNLMLDFNSGNVGTAIRFAQSNQGFLELSNISIKNVNDTNATYLTKLIDFNPGGNVAYFDGISFSNITKLTDGNIGTDAGGIEGLLIRSYNSNDVGAGGTVKNVNISNIRTVNASGTLVDEVCNAIYLVFSGTNRKANISFEKIRGINFGRRLFKLQCSNVSISEVYAEASTSNVALAGIAVLDFSTGEKCKNVQITDAEFVGSMRYGVAAEIDSVTLEKIKTNVTLVGADPNFYAPAGGGTGNAFGVGVWGNDVTLRNSSIRADYGYVMYRQATAGDSYGLVVESTTIRPTKSGGYAINVGNGVSGEAGISLVQDITFSDVIIDNEEFSSDIALGWAALSAASNGTVTLNNVTLIDNDATVTGGSECIIRGFKNVAINGYTHINKAATSSIYRSISMYYNTAVQLSALHMQAKPQFTNVWVSDTTSLLVDGLYVDPSTTFNLNITRVTASRLLGLRREKLSIADDTSRQGCTFAAEFSSGTTALRPTAQLADGRMYWDATLGKPIWWNGSAWKDATGATV